MSSSKHSPPPPAPALPPHICSRSSVFLLQALRCGSADALKALLHYTQELHQNQYSQIRHEKLRRVYEGCISETYFERVAVHIDADDASLGPLKERVELHTLLNRGFLRAVREGNVEVVETLATHLRRHTLLESIRDKVPLVCASLVLM